VAHPFKYFFLAKTAQEMAEDLKEIIRLANKVIDQTFRRVIHGKSVPAFEKLFLSLNLTRTSLSRITGKHSMATKFV
jgi:hypothetical protein